MCYGPTGHEHEQHLVPKLLLLAPVSFFFSSPGLLRADGDTRPCQDPSVESALSHISVVSRLAHTVVGL